MKKIIKSFLLLLFIGVLSFSLGSLASCSDSGSKVPSEVTPVDDGLSKVTFEDATVTYDGNPHNIVVGNLPAGATVEYSGSDFVRPGQYLVVATITLGDKEVEKQATLTISKITSVLEAETTQTVLVYGGNVQPIYTLNNDKQSVRFNYYKDGISVQKADLCKLGTYSVEIYAASNNYYLESNHVTVQLTVKNSNFDLHFDSKTYEADGTTKSIELTGTVPTGYTVEYTNNSASEAGTYLAVAKVKNSAGEVVETHAATLEINQPDNTLFAQYLDDFFVEYLAGDQLSVNIFCENPEDYGLEHYEAKWYTYGSFEEEDVTDTLNYFTSLKAQLTAFDVNTLSPVQQTAYGTIEKFLNYYIQFYGMKDANFMGIQYVDSFGGYVADFGTYMEAYSLRSELEVQDVISYIQSTKDAFPSYALFVKEKAQKGYPLTDTTLNEMIAYLEDVIANDEYYLEEILEYKINAVTFLSDAQKSQYITEMKNAISECFIPGVKQLMLDLQPCFGACTADKAGYLASYEGGKDLYALELERLLGIENLDMNAYIKELDSEFSKTTALVSTLQSRIITNNNITTYEQLEAYLSRYPIFSGTPEEMVEYLKEFAKTIVPDLKSTPEISIKEMDTASAKVSNAVAYYMKSALDNSQGEHITLNPLKLGDINDVLGTLAHEGYPGHLYAYVYSKELNLPNISTIMTSTAHGEGWATYVELKLYEYASSLSTDYNFIEVMDYLYANQKAGFLLETRLDVGIHYEGWDIQKVSTFLDTNGYNGGAAESIYNLLIEMPTSYASYGYGKLFFTSLHDEAKRILGGFYDEIEFNNMLLSKGWTSLGELKKTYDEYMKQTCHKYGLS